jgi:hypothetical protein
VRSDRYFYGLQAAFLQCQLEILAIKTPVTAPLFLVQLAEKNDFNFGNHGTCKRRSWCFCGQSSIVGNVKMLLASHKNTNSCAIARTIEP